MAQQITSPNSEVLSPLSRPRSSASGRRPSLKPLPEMNVASTHSDDELPPQVPPKSPTIERQGSPSPLKLDMHIARTQLLMSASAASGRRTPPSSNDNKPWPKFSTPLPTSPSEIPTPFYAPSLSPSRGSPRSEKRDPISSHVVTAHTRIMSESSVVARGRSADRKDRNLRKHNRTCSEGNSPKSSNVDAWKMPQGMRVPEASTRMCEIDKKLLHKQACDQASNFEVLNKSDVTSMSRVSLNQWTA